MDSLLAWLGQVHFLRPMWLLALIPAVVIVWLLWRRRGRSGQWRDVVAPHLLAHLIDGRDVQHKRWPLFGLLGLWSLAVLALAGPAWQKLPQPVQKSGSALVVAWDMSASMLAQDMKPSRLVRSRLKITDLLEARREGTTGFIAYAGEAHVVTPLTDDTRTIINLLPALSPTVMPMAGSNPEMALSMAFQLLEDAGISQGNVLLVTDEIVPEAFDHLRDLQQGSPHQITVWGVGSTEGAPIPLPQGGFARDARGNIVNARLNEAELQSFTAEIGAYYVPMLQNNEDIETLQTLFTSPAENLRQTDRTFDVWYEHGPWLLLLLLPLAALSFRRGWLMGFAFLCVPLSLPQQAEAGIWEDLWQRKDQQALEHLSEERPEQAAELFQDPAWRGTAHYRAGDYEAALEAFRQAQSNARNLYNQGNALMQMGEFEAAIEAYQAALEQDPAHEDARANKALAEQLLQQKQQQEQQNGDQSQQDQQDSDQNQQGQDSNQNQQGQQSQSGDSDQQSPESNQPNQPSDQNPQQPQDDPSNNREAEENPDERSQSQDEGKGEDQTEQGSPRGQSGEPAEQPESESERAVAQPEMSEQERERQQELEQWLRKVPEDPSGLIRNKFQHEFRERRRTSNWQVPDNNANRRW